MPNLVRALAPTFALATLALLVDLGCREATGNDDAFPAAVVEGPGAPRGAYKVIHRAPEASDAEKKVMGASPGPAHRVLYLNGKGGTYSPGDDDSSTNHSSIPSSTATIPAYEKGASAWSAFVACMKDQYSRFDIEVTDVDPGATPHIEVAVGGKPSAVGMDSGVGGVSPMNDDCSVVERAVVYVFSRQFGSAQEDCEVAAQESGHALGMDHEYLCQDPMTYLTGCGKKSFQDEDAYCGESGPRTCMCGGKTQNSVKWLTKVLGAKPSPGGDDGGAPPPDDAGKSDTGTSDGGAPPPPDDGGAPTPPGADVTGPTVASLTPADGASLPADTTVAVSATIDDPSGVGAAFLRWTIGSKTTDLRCGDFLGEITCSTVGSTYTWQVPVGSGARTWAIRAVDTRGNVTVTGTRTLTLTGSAPPPAPPTPSGPTVSFVQPSAGEMHHPGDHIVVRVNVAAAGSVTSARLLWKSPSGDATYDLDSVGGGAYGLDLDLSWSAVAGPRTLTVTAVDDGGHTGTDSRTIEIAP